MEMYRRSTLMAGTLALSTFVTKATSTAIGLQGSKLVCWRHADVLVVLVIHRRGRSRSGLINPGWCRERKRSPRWWKLLLKTSFVAAEIPLAGWRGHFFLQQRKGTSRIQRRWTLNKY